MGFYLKDPGASIDYTVDWAAGYLAGDEIVSSSWSVEPDAMDGIVVAGSVQDATRTAATLAGGVAGNVYRVSNRVVLASGRIDERSLSIRIEDR